MKYLLISILSLSLYFNIYYLLNRSTQNPYQGCVSKDEIIDKIDTLNEMDANFSEKLFLLLLAELGLKERFQNLSNNETKNCIQEPPQVITKEVQKIVYKEAKKVTKKNQRPKNFNFTQLINLKIENLLKERLLAVEEIDQLKALPSGTFKINHRLKDSFEQLQIEHQLSFTERAWRGSFLSRIIQDEKKKISEVKFNGVNSELFRVPDYDNLLLWKQGDFVIIFNTQKDEFTRHNGFIYKINKKFKKYTLYGDLVEDVN